MLTMLSPRYGIQGIQVRGRMLLFGGQNADGVSDECFVLRMNDTIECKQIGGLAVKSKFLCCSAVLCDRKCVYAIDDKRRNHLYSIVYEKWSTNKMIW